MILVAQGDGFLAKGLAVQEQFHRRAIAHHRHIHQLAFVPVPVHTDVYHGLLVPEGLAGIVGILGEAGGIRVAKVAVAGMIGRGLADVVDARPHELAQRKLGIAVLGEHDAQILGAPAGGAVEQGGALQVIVTEDIGGFREMIDAAAEHHGGGFAAVDDPIRVLGMMILLVFFRVVVAYRIHPLGAVLRALPGHVVGAEGGEAVALGVVQMHFVA